MSVPVFLVPRCTCSYGFGSLSGLLSFVRTPLPGGLLRLFPWISWNPGGLFYPKLWNVCGTFVELSFSNSCVLGRLVSEIYHPNFVTVTLAAAGTAVTREFTRTGEGLPRILYIVRFAVVFRGKPQKRRFVSKGTSSWGSGAPFPRRKRIGATQKSPNPSGIRPKRFFSSRAFDWCPPRPGHPGPIARHVLRARARWRVFYITGLPPALAPLVRVDGSRKLPQIKPYLLKWFVHMCHHLFCLI